MPFRSSRPLFVASFIGLVACSNDAATGASPADAAASDAAAPAPDAASTTSASDAGDAGLPPDPTCAAYCSALSASCTGARAQFLSDAECAAVCTTYSTGAYGDADDTLGCRQAHAVAAARDPAQCAAAGPFGGGACGDRCDAFCHVMLDVCTGAAAPYTNKTLCWNDCTNRFPYDADAGEYTSSGATLNCREGALLRAGVPDAGDLASACAAAGPSSTTCQ